MPRLSPSRTQQTGLAAIEFALLGTFVMVPILLGIFVFWEVLQTQQVVSRATGDGARQVLRILQSPRERKANGAVQSDEEVRSAATALARDSISAMLRNHLSHVSDLSSRLTIELQPGEPGQWVLSVAYARPLLLGSVGGMNFIEPTALQARSVIHWP